MIGPAEMRLNIDAALRALDELLNPAHFETTAKREWAVMVMAFPLDRIGTVHFGSSHKQRADLALLLRQAADRIEEGVLEA